MKVFISHKKEDSSCAMQIKQAFDQLHVESYLDVLDNTLLADGLALTQHIKRQLNTCTDIIVVMSENTKYSWWVPFEIGMSAQLDMPTASFLTSSVVLPDYLTDWPRLRKISDVATYVTVRMQVANYIKKSYPYTYSQPSCRNTETFTFYNQLKQALR